METFGVPDRENALVTVTVTVTEEFVVRPPQLVRWHITQSNCRVYDAPKTEENNKSWDVA